MARSRIWTPPISWFAALALLLSGATPITASACCESSPPFLEKAQWPCATVLVVVVEQTPPDSDFRPTTVRVTHVLRGAYPDRSLAIWGGGGFIGPPRGFTVGSTWAVLPHPIEGAGPQDVWRHGFGSECTGEIAMPLGPDDPSGSALRKQLDGITAASLPRFRSECLSGDAESCYAAACADEQGLGVRRNLTSARALYRRAYELQESLVDE